MKLDGGQNIGCWSGKTEQPTMYHYVAIIVVCYFIFMYSHCGLLSKQSLG